MLGWAFVEVGGKDLLPNYGERNNQASEFAVENKPETVVTAYSTDNPFAG